MAMLKSLKLLAKMQFEIYNNVHPTHTYSVHHYKTLPTIIVLQRSLQNQLPLMFMALLTFGLSS
jgi:hypothetical protein